MSRDVETRLSVRRGGLRLGWWRLRDQEQAQQAQHEGKDRRHGHGGRIESVFNEKKGMLRCFLAAA